MTQLQCARLGIVTDAMKIVSEDENIDVATVCSSIACGESVIPMNKNHRQLEPVGVGRIFKTKINANLGRSVTHSDKGDELDKLRIALNAGADFVMDLSVGSDNLREIRQGMLDNCPKPLGTVPIYETISVLGDDIPKMNINLLLEVIKSQAEQGVDFMTLHAGLLKRHIPSAMNRVMGIVSRGGAIMAEWMMSNDKENPLYTNWDKVLDILVEHDVTVSLGDGLRPGCLADASDTAQFGELQVLGELVKRCRSRGVQVMVEGPGHIPFNEIKMNMQKQQILCHNAPFYVLGPIVTDIAPGYDHIVSAIGATAAATYGASLLCYVTPAEHLGLPNAEEVYQGCKAFKIAAHAGDVARGLPGAQKRDNEMAEARADFDWNRQFEVSIDSQRSKARWLQTRKLNTIEKCDDHCSMCGKQFCALRTSKRIKALYESIAD